jgi:hypothetical protein
VRTEQDFDLLMRHQRLANLTSGNIQWTIAWLRLCTGTGDKGTNSPGGFRRTPREKLTITTLTFLRCIITMVAGLREYLLKAIPAGDASDQSDVQPACNSSVAN